MSISTYPLFLLLSAPSGAGKTTLCRELLKSRLDFRRVVTCTTRAPRGTEENGVDYHFLSHEDFRSKIHAGEFLEHAEVFGNLYGTLKASVEPFLEAGEHLILNIDYQGARSIRQTWGEESRWRDSLLTVFLVPVSMQQLRRQLESRNENHPEEVLRRLAEVEKEMSHRSHYDYNIPSGSIQENLDRLLSILKSESMRPHRLQLSGWSKPGEF